MEQLQMRDGLEELSDEERDRIVHAQMDRADTPTAQEALAQVHEEARKTLAGDLEFEEFVWAAGAAALEGWRVSEAAEIYRRLQAYDAAHAWAEHSGLLGALRRFLFTQGVNAGPTAGGRAIQPGPSRLT
jgi:hypothetical protein